MATRDVYDLDYNLTPVMSTTAFGRVDWRFECRECGHETLLKNAFPMQHVLAHDHYRGECPKRTLR